VTNLFDADENATPLAPNERDGLIPTHVTLRGELNELEQKNIAAGDVWAFSRKRDVTDEDFLKSLHRRMFGEVWRWASDYRTTEKNIGVLPHLIGIEMRQALDDVKYQIEHKSYEPDELAVRFHHKLVSIHPFANGNGRWSRMAGDLMITQLGGQRFSWGGAHLQPSGAARKAYIAALKAADNHDFGPIIAFARS
jgi:Fic-DOC domain mobile mystery protein B